MAETTPERVPDRHHQVADADFVGVAERQGRQRRARQVHLKQRQVRIEVGADQLGPCLAAVGEVDLDSRGAFDDVLVGHDVAIAVDDEARALGDRGRRTLGAGLAVIDPDRDHARARLRVQIGQIRDPQLDGGVGDGNRRWKLGQGRLRDGHRR